MRLTWSSGCTDRSVPLGKYWRARPLKFSLAPLPGAGPLREESLADGDSLAVQYDDLRRPGKNRLRDLHEELDAAVFRAYGFSAEDEILTQLLALNLELAEQPEIGRAPGPWEATESLVTSYRIIPPEM